MLAKYLKQTTTRIFLKVFCSLLVIGSSGVSAGGVCDIGYVVGLSLHEGVGNRNVMVKVDSTGFNTGTVQKTRQWFNGDLVTMIHSAGGPPPPNSQNYEETLNNLKLALSARIPVRISVAAEKNTCTEGADFFNVSLCVNAEDCNY